MFSLHDINHLGQCFVVGPVVLDDDVLERLPVLVLIWLIAVASRLIHFDRAY
jgi:hypothetical protein